MKHDLEQTALHFQLGGPFTHGEPYGSGHINDTYAVTCDVQGKPVRYIFQRINHVIFSDIPALMDNIARVTRHVRQKLEAEGVDDLDRKVLTLIPTRDGRDYLEAEDGLSWRVYEFIEDATTYDMIESTDQAYQAAKAFGRFQCLLSDLPAPRLHETIPQFHHTRSRFNTLIRALETDARNRAVDTYKEITFVKQREEYVDRLLDLQAAGDLPERITHNDTKLNNVMIDDVSSEGICVIDLDTVMPGLSLYDFGDMVRTATNTGAEDDLDLSAIESDLTMFEALVKGYLHSARSVLVDQEIDHLPFSGKLITLETGIRFLTDYLMGDVYFKIHHPSHNLQRARAQFKLVQSIERQEEKMKQMVRMHV